MNKKEIKELSELLSEFRNTINEEIYNHASDFDILKAFVQCAIIQTKDITRKG